MISFSIVITFQPIESFFLHTLYNKIGKNLSIMDKWIKCAAVIMRCFCVVIYIFILLIFALKPAFNKKVTYLRIFLLFSIYKKNICWLLCCLVVQFYEITACNPIVQNSCQISAKGLSTNKLTAYIPNGSQRGSTDMSRWHIALYRYSTELGKDHFWQALIFRTIHCEVKCLKYKCINV